MNVFEDVSCLKKQTTNWIDSKVNEYLNLDDLDL